MRLQFVVPRGSSSLNATSVRLERTLPVKRLTRVLKLLPVVVSVSPPSAGAVQVHQTDLAASKEGSGSPGSIVASMLFPVVETLLPDKTMRVAKLSFSGMAAAPRTAAHTKASTATIA